MLVKCHYVSYLTDLIPQICITSYNFVINAKNKHAYLSFSNSQLLAFWSKFLFQAFILVTIINEDLAYLIIYQHLCNYSYNSLTQICIFKFVQDHVSPWKGVALLRSNQQSQGGILTLTLIIFRSYYSIMFV